MHSHKLYKPPNYTTLHDGVSNTILLLVSLHEDNEANKINASPQPLVHVLDNSERKP